MSATRDAYTIANWLRMASRRALEQIGKFKGLAGFRHEIRIQLVARSKYRCSCLHNIAEGQKCRQVLSWLLSLYLSTCGDWTAIIVCSRILVMVSYMH